MAYYMTVAKRFWMIGLALVALPVIIIARRKKAAKTIEINLDLDAAPSLQSTASGEPAGQAVMETVSAAEPDKKAAENIESDIDKKEPAAPVKKVRTVVRKVVKSVPKSDKSADEKTGESEGDGLADGSSSETAAEEKENPALKPAAVIQPSGVAPATVEPVNPYYPGFSAPAAEVVNPVAEKKTQHAPTGYESIHARHQAEIEKIRELTRPGRPAAVTVDPELDNLWSSLSRKAMQGRIAPQYRKEEAFAKSSQYVSGAAPGHGFSSSVEPDDNVADVAIDLSEEALKDDLVGKLKMMAISDAELRDLFALKNPRHIPHLIEYVLTRPEPLRLAFVARELGIYEDPAVIDTLASLLYHEDGRVALAAIQGLERTKKPLAVLHLCPFLKSEIPLLAQAARSALSNLGAVRILQALKELPSHPDVRIREAGVFVLSRMSGSAVEELLKKMLNDEVLDIRSSVILAMSYQKNPAYIDCLREFFRIAADSDKTLARKAIVYLQGFVARKK
jgi:hypothetical protein